MSSIEFRSSNERVYCRVLYHDKCYVVRDSEFIDDLFKSLLRYGIPFERKEVEGFVIVNFFNVEKRIDEFFKNNRNIRRKVTRKNISYVPVVATASSFLVMFMCLHNMKKTDDFLKENAVVSDFHPLPTASFNEVMTLEESDVTFLNTGNSLNSYCDTLDFEYEDRSHSARAELTRAMYRDVITKYANMYGLPPALMIAVATQESTIHSNVVNSNGSVGLMQIQVEGGWNWIGNEISAFNYETNMMETLVVGQRDDGVIDKSIVGDLEYNIKVACMIMSYDLKFCNYDLGAAIQTYNSGTKVSSLVKEYGDDWVNYRQNLPGDEMYLEHVLSFISPEERYLRFKTNEGDNVLEVNNLLLDNVVKNR